MSECCETCRYYQDLKLFKRHISQISEFKLAITTDTTSTCRDKSDLSHCCTAFQHNDQSKAGVYETTPNDICEYWCPVVEFKDSEFEMAKAFNDLKHKMNDLFNGKFTNGDSIRNLEENSQLALLLWNLPKFSTIEELQDWLNRDIDRSVEGNIHE